jgi:membrane protein YqaA with SNARE-associated domain
LKTIGHILARYTAWILGLLKVLGIWGVFVIAFADSALLGMPVDFVVARPTCIWTTRGFCSTSRWRRWVGPGQHSAVHVIGYLGGEKVLRKRISEERFLKIHRSFEQHEFWALMFPGMLPPPMPFKIFVLGAAVFEMRFRDFLVAIFLGRFVRFLVLSALVLWFGPQIVELFGTVVMRHWVWVVAAIVAGICVMVGVALEKSGRDAAWTITTMRRISVLAVILDARVGPV